jgi:glycosyltransferase involved in cell wall biosynthesis
MTIFFLGAPLASREEFVLNLARSLTPQHRVTWLSPSPRSFRYFGAVQLIYSLPSLAWLRVVKHQPHLVHFHGSSLPLALIFLKPFLRVVKVVWTIDQLPSKPNLFTRLSLFLSPRFFNNLTTPSRVLQYRLLTEYGLRVSYLPDGFEAPTFPLIPAKTFKLRQHQYALALLDSPAALRSLASAYQPLRTRKPLVVLSPDPARLRRTAGRYSFVKLLPLTGHRRLLSLLSSAAVIVFPDSSTPVSLLLPALHAGRPLLATTFPLYEETLGTASQFIKPDDSAGLTAALKKVISQRPSQAAWGAKAHQRATHHFSLTRITEEYRALYRSLISPLHLINLDAASARLLPKTSPL